MPGLFDLIQGAMGRPDPSMQIRAALNPLAGVPSAGTPAGPAGPPGASGGPAAPGGPAPPDGPPGGPGGPAPAPPQPQAYQTPPDLGSMFVQLMQRQQANEGFNRGLGMLAAGFANNPRDRETMINAMSGQSGDPASLMGNVMKLTQYSQQQQRLADMQKNLPAIADAMGLPLPALQTMFASNPEGFGAEIARIQEAQMGLTGDPVQRELAQTRREWMKANPGKTEADMIAAKPELAGPIEFQAGRTQQVNETAARTKDLSADRANFPKAKDAFDSVLADLDTLKNSKALPDILGSLNQYKTKGMVGLPPDQADALALYDKIMGGQYAAGVQDFKGAGRITQQELNKDLPSQSTMPNRNTTVESFQKSIDAYKAKLQAKRAQLFGAAGQLDSPDLSDEDYDKFVSPIYKPGGDLYVPGQGPRPQKAASPAEAGSASNAPAIKTYNPKTGMIE